MKGLVLAGGESLRFGRDKALAPWKEGAHESYAERAYRTLTGFFDEVWVSRRGTQQLGFTRQVLWDESLESLGPSAGLRAAHQKYPSEDWFVMACDFPYADSECVEYLLAHWKKSTSEAGDAESPAALVFRSAEADVYEPLLGIWRPRALELFFGEPLPSPQQVLIRVGAKGISGYQPQWLINKNQGP